MVAQMLTVCHKPEEWKGVSLACRFEVEQPLSLSRKIEIALDEVKKMPVDGCITGSVWLEKYDPELWASTPDIDLFVYSEHDLFEAITYARYAMDMTPGTGTERSKLQEETKIRILKKSGINRKYGISTFKFYESGVILNISYKMSKVNGHWSPLSSVFDVLRSFDMDIVMQGYDIESHSFIDLRMNDGLVAHPNPLREFDCTTWGISKWIRQFDRVIKYYDRGYDTRPVAEFYIRMIDECLKTGSIFDSEQSQKTFESYVPEFVEKRAAMVEWLEAHEND